MIVFPFSTFSLVAPIYFYVLTQDFLTLSSGVGSLFKIDNRWSHCPMSLTETQNVNCDTLTLLSPMATCKGVIHFDVNSPATFHCLSDATMADCVTWSKESSQIIGHKGAIPPGTDSISSTLGTSDCDIFLALYPFGQLTSQKAAPENLANWKVVGYDILARARGGGDRFPLDWYTQLTKSERLQWTLECALLSAFLKHNGVMARFKIQEEHYPRIQSELQSYSLTMDDVYCELMESREPLRKGKAKGKAGKPPFKMRRLGESILGKFHNVTLDNCGQEQNDKGRSFEAVLDLVQKQASRLDNGSLNVPSFDTIKINRGLVDAAFRAREEMPDAEGSEQAKLKITNFVESVWRSYSKMQFVIEATVIGSDKLSLIPCLGTSDGRVCYQGCHHSPSCILINCSEATIREWQANRKREEQENDTDSTSSSHWHSMCQTQKAEHYRKGVEMTILIDREENKIAENSSASCGIQEDNFASETKTNRILPL